MAEHFDPVERLWAWIRERPERTQGDLARLARASLPSVWRWLHRKTVPSYTSMRRLERELGIPVSSWPAGDAEGEHGPATPAAE